MTAAWSTSSLGEAYLGEMYLTAAGDDGVPVVDDTPPDPYTLGGRVTAYRWDILNPDDVRLGELDVEGGSLSWSVDREIRSTGMLTWAGLTVPEWTQIRVQPWVSIDFADGETDSWPLGVYLPATPTIHWSDAVATADVDLYDKLLILVEDKVNATFAVPAGAVVTEQVEAIIASAGESRMSIAASTATLRSAMVWEPGTTKLRIINDLLAAINYFSLWVDGYGYFRSDPYQAPQYRVVRRSFTDGVDSIYSPDFAHDRDTFSVPNVVTLISRADGATPALTSTASNDDPTDPLSTVSRGREIEVVEVDVEAASQVILDDLAKRRLEDLSRVSSTLDLEHAPVPLALNDRVQFRSTIAGITTSGVVQGMTVDCDPLALMRCHIQEVR